jgi:hypothetical protein
VCRIKPLPRLHCCRVSAGEAQFGVFQIAANIAKLPELLRKGD